MVTGVLPGEIMLECSIATVFSWTLVRNWLVLMMMIQMELWVTVVTRAKREMLLLMELFPGMTHGQPMLVSIPQSMPGLPT